MTTKVENMRSPRTGREIPNQYIIREYENTMSGNCVQYFQSYSTIIAKMDRFRPDVKTRKVWLDANKWDYSKTTGKYRNIFLGETKKETERKIADGTYELVDLNA